MSSSRGIEERISKAGQDVIDKHNKRVRNEGMQLQAVAPNTRKTFNEYHPTSIPVK